MRLDIGIFPIVPSAPGNRAEIKSVCATEKSRAEPPMKVRIKPTIIVPTLD